MQDTFNRPEDFNEPDRFSWMNDVKKAHPNGISITSMEVWHAVLGARLNSSSSDKNQQPHAFFAFRDTGFMSQVADDWKWVFDYEYRGLEDKVNKDSEQQYQRTQLCEQYRSDFDTITKQIRAAKDRCVCFDYKPQGKPIVEQTGKLPNGKRFGTGVCVCVCVCVCVLSLSFCIVINVLIYLHVYSGTVQGLDQFAQQVFSMLYTAINNEYPAYTTPLDDDTMSSVQVYFQEEQGGAGGKKKHFRCFVFFFFFFFKKKKFCSFQKL